MLQLDFQSRCRRPLLRLETIVRFVDIDRTFDQSLFKPNFHNLTFYFEHSVTFVFIYDITL